MAFSAFIHLFIFLFNTLALSFYKLHFCTIKNLLTIKFIILKIRSMKQSILVKSKTVVAVFLQFYFFPEKK